MTSFSRIAIISVFILTAALVTSGVFNYRIVQTYEESQRKFNAANQQLLEINYTLEQLKNGLEQEKFGLESQVSELGGENSRLKEFSEKQKELAAAQAKTQAEQQKIIKSQQQLTKEQEQKLSEKIQNIEVLQTQLGGAKTEIEQLKKTGGEPLPKDFINSLIQATVRIRCRVSRNGFIENFKAGSGSVLGKYEGANGENVIMTNAHVLEPDVTTGEPNCEVIFGEDTNYDSTVLRKVFSGNLDFAFLKLGNPEDETITVTPVSYSDLGVGFCEFKDVEVGDRITILSYPRFQGPENAVSEGFITSILEGPIYEATATIDLGSSGGVAVLNKKRCALGMPTWKGVGSRLGLSYIQSWPMMLSFGKPN